MEILLIIAVSGIIILVLANVPSSLGLIGSSNYESIAKQIATQAIEDTRSKPYDNLANNIPNGTPISDTRLSKIPMGTARLYIEDCPQSICVNSEDVKKVSVKVTWKEKQNKNIDIATFISRGGLH